jgi:aspartyl/asparaginyl beta-hydroxylase (cupin superfamily)
MWDRCPATAAALERVPGLCLGDMPFGSAFFSTLRPGAAIKPHYAPCNLRVRCHLPLLVPEPEKCGIRVADETRQWEPGRCLLFDDAFEHEVWNRGAQERVVLLFDVWHYELSADEIVSIQAMFREVEAIRDARQAATST